MKLNAFRERLDKAEDEAAQLRGEVPDTEAARAKLALIVQAQRAVLEWHEGEAAKPYSQRGIGVSPEAARLRMWGDEAVARQVAEGRERLEANEARLAELSGS